VGDRFSVSHEIRDDVVAEIMARVWIGSIAAEFVHQERGVKHIDTHACKRHFGVANHGRRVLGLFHK